MSCSFATSWRGRRSSARFRPCGKSSSTAACWLPLRTARSSGVISPNSPTTLKRRATGWPSSPTRPPPADRQPACGRTARPRPSTRGPFASPITSRRRRADLLERRSYECYFTGLLDEAVAAAEAALALQRETGIGARKAISCAGCPGSMVHRSQRRSGAVRSRGTGGTLRPARRARTGLGLQQPGPTPHARPGHRRGGRLG